MTALLVVALTLTPAQAELEQAERQLGTGGALAAAERLLAGPLDPADRQRAFALAAAAAAVQGDTRRARFYQLAAAADPGIPETLLHDVAERRYREAAAAGQALLAAGGLRPAKEQSLRLLLFDALLSLARYEEAADVAGGLAPDPRGELLLLAASRLADHGRIEAALDAAIAAGPSIGEQTSPDEPADLAGFNEARAALLARAWLFLGEWDAAAPEAALLLASDDGERRENGRRWLRLVAARAGAAGRLGAVADAIAALEPEVVRAVREELARRDDAPSCALLAAIDR